MIDEHGKEKAIFTGDTLFIGDVGRPDLAQKVVEELTQEKLASMMYDSLRNKIMPLPDDVSRLPRTWCRERLWKEHEQGDFRYPGQSKTP